MKAQRKILSGAIAAIAALVLARLVSANGAHFFLPASETGPIDLVYFGQIKDEQGRLLDDAEVVVSVKNLGIVVPIENYRRGRYRTPDIGAIIKELGEKVDTSQITILCKKRGYRQVRPEDLAVPRKAKGAIEIGFRMAAVEVARSN